MSDITLAARYTTELSLEIMDSLDGLFAPPLPTEPFNTSLARAVAADKDLGSRPPLRSPYCTLPAPTPDFYDNTMALAYAKAREIKREHPEDLLADNPDFIAAIHIYTQESKPHREYSIYYTGRQ